MEFLWFLLIGLIAGWLAGILVRGRGYGVAVDIIVGVVGAFLGGYLFRLLGYSPGSTLWEILTATVGAVVLLVIIKAVKKAT